ncbi:MAG: glycosyltransferase family 2 protein [bacterium]
MRTGIIIPAYNAGKRLSNVLLKSLNHVPAKHIYVVDDGSTDSTADVSVQFGVVLFQHSKNLGKGEALKSGFRLALSDNLDGVFTIDGDGQHDPDCIPDFIRIMKTKHCDLVMGVRSFQVGVMPIDRICSNTLTSTLVSLIVRQRIPDSQCGYRLIKTSILHGMRFSSSRYEFETELLIKAAWRGAEIGCVPISLVYGDYHSHIRRLEDTKRFCSLILRLMKDRAKLKAEALTLDN